MQKWEYRQLVRTTAALPGQQQPTITFSDSHGVRFEGHIPDMQVVNQLGTEGWELVAVTETFQVGQQSNAEMAARSLWFKRPIDTD